MSISKEHWENIYNTKQPHELSWWQENPSTSLDFVHQFNIPKTASLIDIGGGDSKFVDALLAEGYEHITVLDISEKALHRAKERLGDKATKVHWIVSDITAFVPTTTYDFWHDRAAFHFLTTPLQISQYLDTARHAVKDKGYATIGTFSTTGPKKCSGLEIHQYEEETLTAELENGFKKIRCITEDHRTPFDTIQNFMFCIFERVD